PKKETRRHPGQGWTIRGNDVIRSPPKAPIMRRERTGWPGPVSRRLSGGDRAHSLRNEIVATTKTVTTEHSRRDFLYIATASVGAVGAAAVAWPLINSMNPDASVLALSSTEVDLSPIEEAQIVTVKWQGKPVFISHRTKKEIKEAE